VRRHTAVRPVLLFLLALVITACGTSGPVQCGACPGAGLVLRGGPQEAALAGVTECVTNLPCVTHGATLGPDARRYQQPLATLDSTPWEDLDGVMLTVTVRTPHGVWHGHGTLRYRPGGTGPCDCDDLTAVVPLTAVSRRG
jgi:hypothetical protein